MVNWQLAKRRAGTHKAKGISDISGTTKKPWRQKGTGRARQGSLRSPQFRGGARDLRPGRAQPRIRPAEEGAPARRSRPRSRRSRPRASSSCSTRRKLDERQDRRARRSLPRARLGVGADHRRRRRVDENFARAARNLPKVDVLPQQGANVYDILRRDTLVLTQDAVRASGGAPQMSRFRFIPRFVPEAHARADVRARALAGHHREGDQDLRAQPGDLPRAARRRQARRSRRRSRACSRSR